jgi:hypothetical protein
MAQKTELDYLQWQALIVLYRNRERTSSPLRYVGLETAVTGLIKHQPPLAEWVGKHSDHQVHITPAGITLYESGTSQ